MMLCPNSLILAFAPKFSTRGISPRFFFVCTGAVGPFGEEETNGPYHRAI